MCNRQQIHILPRRARHVRTTATSMSYDPRLVCSVSSTAIARSWGGWNPCRGYFAYPFRGQWKKTNRSAWPKRGYGSPPLAVNTAGPQARQGRKAWSGALVPDARSTRNSVQPSPVRAFAGQDSGVMLCQKYVHSGSRIILHLCPLIWFAMTRKLGWVVISSCRIAPGS